MIYECTDCKLCADFSDGFRVFCLHPDLQPDEVLEYYPLGDNDAMWGCAGFEEGESHMFTWDDLGEAEDYSIDKHGEVTYAGIREWCEKRLAEVAGLDEILRKESPIPPSDLCIAVGNPHEGDREE